MTKLSSVLLLCFLSAPALAVAPPPAQPSPAALYRFEVSITGIDDPAHPGPATYTIVLRENERGEISTGANIPLGAGSGAARQNVGLDLRLLFQQSGGALLLDGDFGLSTAEQTATGTTVRRIEAKGAVALLTPGTPALMSSVYDLATHRRYDVTVTAKKLP